MSPKGKQRTLSITKPTQVRYQVGESDGWCSQEILLMDIMYIALEAARKAYNDVNNEIQSLERNLQTINDDLGKDYGEKHEWLKLKDTCVEKNEGEYVYYDT